MDKQIGKSRCMKEIIKPKKMNQYANMDVLIQTTKKRYQPTEAVQS